MQPIFQMDVPSSAPPTRSAMAEPLAIYPGLTLFHGDNEHRARELFEALAQSAAQENAKDGSTCVSLYWHDGLARSGNTTSGRAWLAEQQQCFITWDTTLLDDLLAAFDLDEHVDKPLYMYSLGTARKLNLAAAFASGATITCLEAPFGALDGPSRSLLAELLSEAAGHPSRAWLMFDFQRPELLAQARFAHVSKL